MILFIWQTVQSTPSVTAYYLFYGINVQIYEYVVVFFILSQWPCPLDIDKEDVT